MVAAWGDYYLQATDADLRISSRRGFLWADVDLTDFLAVPTGDVVIGNMSVLYDQVTGRWVLAGFSASCSTGRVYLAVSSSADPLGVWNAYRFDLPGVFPYLPRIGFSQSKYALAFSDYAWSGCAYGAYQGAEIQLLDGVDVRAGVASPAGSGYGPDSQLFDPVPAVTLTNTDRLEFVAEDLGSDPSGIAMFAMTGPADSWTIVDTASLATVTGHDWPTAIQPRGFPAGTSAVVPSGPIQLVTYGQRTYLVGNTACTPAGDSAARPCVGFASLSRPSGSTALLDDFAVGTSGVDLFAPTIVSVGTGNMIAIAVSQAGSPSGSAAWSVWTTWRSDSDAVGQLGEAARLGEIPDYTTYPDRLWTAYAQGNPQPGQPGQLSVLLPRGDAFNGVGRDTWNSRIVEVGWSGTAQPPTGTLQVAPGESMDPWNVHLRSSSSASFQATQLLVSASAAISGGKLSMGAPLPIGSGVSFRLDDPSYGGSAAVGVRTLYYQWGNGAGTWSAVQTRTVTVAGPVKAARYSGADRYLTAVAISKGAVGAAGTNLADSLPLNPGVRVAVVATGANFPDALAGAAAAGRLGGPVLLVKKDSIPAGVLTELDRLRPQRIIILGGTGVVSALVEAQLNVHAPAGAMRLAGPDRYATNAAVSATLFARDVYHSAHYVFRGHWPELPGCAGRGTACRLLGRPRPDGHNQQPACSHQD